MVRAPEDDRPPVRPDRAEVRRAVLHAARAVFRREGFHGASTAAIAREAGFSKGAVYSNFAGKDDLFLSLLVDETLAVAGRSAMTAVDTTARSLSPTDPAERLERAAHVVARGLVDLSAETWPVLVLAEFRAHVARDPERAARAAAVHAEVVASVAAWLDGGLRRRGLRCRVPVSELATVLMALVSGLVIDGHDPHGRLLVEVGTLASTLAGLVEVDDGQHVGEDR